MGNIQEHLDDIDFRSREVRRASKAQTYKDWYDQLYEFSLRYDDERIQGQLTMLSAVLWHELPKSEYKKFIAIKKK